MGLRDLYNRVEQVASPLANTITHADEFAQLAALVGGVNKTLRDVANGVAARAWHAVNLPAGTDVQRLRTQVGALDREIRLLTLELEKPRQKEVTKRGTPRNEHDRPSTP